MCVCCFLVVSCTGNRRFRDLCFKRKPEFDAASHAAKRRIANEIVVATKETGGRFLKRKVDKGPWFEMDDEKALLKACQVMRDYQRPDRIALRQASGNGRKRQRLGELSTEPAAPVRKTMLQYVYTTILDRIPFHSKLSPTFYRKLQSLIL